MKLLVRLAIPAAAVALAPTVNGQIQANTADLILDGPPSAGFAESVAIVPDLDGDLRADIAVGAIAFDPLDDLGFPINNAGGVMVFSSTTGLPIRAFEGVERDGNLGFGIITLPDRNGDGVYELAAGAPRMSNGLIPEAGAVMIFSGATGDVLDTIYGEGGARTLFGTSLAVIGDLDGDGMPEFVAGASGTGDTNPPSPGFAVVFDGATLAPLQVIPGEAPGDVFGASVAGGGDLNNDGKPDFLVGAPLVDTPSNQQQGATNLDAGRLYAFSGDGFGVLHAIDHYDGIGTPMANFGTSVAVLGDLDGDGSADFAAGGPESQQGSGGNGFVAVYSGATGNFIHDIPGAEFTGEQHGTRVMPLDDVDGDGTADFAAASSQTCFGFCSSRPGEVIVYSGATGTPLATYEGEVNGDNFGAAFAAGDLDDDGGVDFLFAAPFQGSGRAYLFVAEPGSSGCPEDIDGSGSVDFGDLVAVLSAWGPCDGCTEDLDTSGAVDFSDLVAVLSAWDGRCD